MTQKEGERTGRAICVFLKAQAQAETDGRQKFTCPLCGGAAWWSRNDVNGHLWCGCQGCGFGMME